MFHTKNGSLLFDHNLIQFSEKEKNIERKRERELCSINFKIEKKERMKKEINQTPHKGICVVGCAWSHVSFKGSVRRPCFVS